MAHDQLSDLQVVWLVGQSSLNLLEQQGFRNLGIRLKAQDCQGSASIGSDHNTLSDGVDLLDELFEHQGSEFVSIAQDLKIVGASRESNALGLLGRIRAISNIGRCSVSGVEPTITNSQLGGLLIVPVPLHETRASYPQPLPRVDANLDSFNRRSHAIQDGW